MNGMISLRLLFLVSAIIVVSIGTFASVTIVTDFTPLTGITLAMIGYCYGLGTVFFFIYLRLLKGHKESMTRIRKEHATTELKPETTQGKRNEKEQEPSEKEAEY
jgi:hypothetical protein